VNQDFTDIKELIEITENNLNREVEHLTKEINKLKFHRFLRKFKDHTNYLSKKSPIGMKIEFQFLCQYLLLFH
jgi:hypothetical protein